MTAQLVNEIQKGLDNFPKIFDQRLNVGLNRLSANSQTNFIPLRSHVHLKKLLLAQFFLQRKMENALRNHHEQKPLFLKLFTHDTRICCAVVFLSSHAIYREQLLKIFDTLLPNIQDVPHSFYQWYHPEFSYQFCYLELEKLPSRKLTKKDLRSTEKALKDHILAIPPLTPALFWPFNEEESFRQIKLLRKEMHSPSTLPHISILFQEQTLKSLEFLIHYVRPKEEESIEQSLKKIPFDLFWRFQKNICHPFAIEMGAFSLKIPSSLFDMRGSINLLYARRHLTQYLETIFGPFRDCNGSLFEKQQHYFEFIQTKIRDKIPLFDLFAEKVFYALQPVEARITLSLHDAENLLMAFSEILQSEKECVQMGDNILVLKHRDNDESFTKNLDQNAIHAQVTLGNAEFFCCIGKAHVQ